ncbi:MAG: glutaredoxin family protein [Actinomycetota bacterium]
MSDHTVAASRSHLPAPRIVLLTRAGCHLCEQARDVVSRVAQEVGVTWREDDVDASGELQEKYGEFVPVVFIDGEQHDFWRINEVRLQKALSAI